MKALTNKGLIPSLNGLRAISILVVIMAHLSRCAGMPPSAAKWIHILFNGNVGVRMFFVISGFLITYLLIQERQKYGFINIKSFYIRRLLRIFPVFYAYISVLIMLKISGLITISAWNVLISFFYAENFNLHGHSWFTFHSWSLAVEEQFYLLWPAIFKRINIFSIKYYFAIVLVGALMRSISYKFPGASIFVLAPFFQYADFLFTGCFIAFLFSKRPGMIDIINEKIRKNKILLPICVVGIWFVNYVEMHPVLDIIFVPVSGIVTEIASGIILIYAIKESNGRLGWFLNSRIMNGIGKLSYSLYVWQQIFTGGPEYTKSGTWLGKFPLNLVYIASATLISYQLIEKPFLKLKDKYGRTRLAKA